MATRKNEAARKNEPPPQQTPKNALVILTVGCLLVAGLVVWALTRTVEPAAPAPVAPVANQTAAPVPTNTTPFLPTDTAGLLQTTGTTSPVQVSIDGAPPQTVPQSTAPIVPPSAGPTEDSVRRIAAEDVRDKINAGAAVLVDVRDAPAFAQGHIPGAVNMPFSSVQTLMNSLPKDKEIITYCT